MRAGAEQDLQHRGLNIVSRAAPAEIRAPVLRESVEKRRDLALAQATFWFGAEIPTVYKERWRHRGGRVGGDGRVASVAGWPATADSGAAPAGGRAAEPAIGPGGPMGLPPGFRVAHGAVRGRPGARRVELTMMMKTLALGWGPRLLYSLSLTTNPSVW